MTEKIEKLVRMANQIADFFGPYPDAEATAGIETHLRSFWTPAMRKDLLDFAEAGGQGLRPRVVVAIARFRAGPSPLDKAVAGQKEAQAASDAG